MSKRTPQVPKMQLNLSKKLKKLPRIKYPISYRLCNYRASINSSIKTHQISNQNACTYRSLSSPPLPTPSSSPAAITTNPTNNHLLKEKLIPQQLPLQWITSQPNRQQPSSIVKSSWSTNRGSFSPSQNSPPQICSSIIIINRLKWIKTCFSSTIVVLILRGSFRRSWATWINW